MDQGIRPRDMTEEEWMVFGKAVEGGGPDVEVLVGMVATFYLGLLERKVGDYVAMQLTLVFLQCLFSVSK